MAGYNNNVKNNLTAVFQDTLDFINEEEALYDCIEYSKRESELIKADEYYDLETPSRAGKIKVTQSKTFEAAMRYAEDEANADKLIAVLAPRRRRRMGSDRAGRRPLQVFDIVSSIIAAEPCDEFLRTQPQSPQPAPHRRPHLLARHRYHQERGRKLRATRPRRMVQG